MALKIKVHIDEPVLIELEEEEFMLGRSSKNDLKLDDPKCSAVHCSLRKFMGKATIKDFDSSNGTYIDESLVEESFICIGQKVRVGRTLLTLEPEFMTPQEYQAHKRVNPRKGQMEVDIEKGLKHKTLLINKIVSKASQSRIMANKKIPDLGDDIIEVEKTTHVKKIEKIREERKKGRFARQRQRAMGLLTKIVKIFKK